MVLSIADYVLQGILLLLVFVYPWFLREDQKLRAFFVPFLAIFAWGVWRFAKFDIERKNDMPGIAYIGVAFVYSAIAFCCHGLRCAVLRRKARKASSNNQDPNSPSANKGT